MTAIKKMLFLQTLSTEGQNKQKTNKQIKKTDQRIKSSINRFNAANMLYCTLLCSSREALLCLHKLSLREHVIVICFFMVYNT